MVDSKTMFNFQNKNDAAHIAPRQKSPGELVKKNRGKNRRDFQAKKNPRAVAQGSDLMVSAFSNEQACYESDKPEKRHKSLG